MFGLFRRCWSGRFLLGRLATASAEQSQGILGAKGEATNGLFPGGTQSDVDASVVGQAHREQVLQNLLLFRRAQVRIRFDHALDLLGGHVLLKAEGLGLQVIRGDTFFNEIALGALYAALGEFHVVVLGTANVRVTLENQVSVRFVLQILLEVARQCIERRSLAWGQATTGLRHRRLRRREVNAVQCQLGFQLLDLRWLLHVHIAGSISAGAAAVIHGALHAVAPGLETCRIKLHIGAAAHDLSARRRVAVGQRIVVRVTAVASDAGMLARQNGAALDGECRRRRMIRRRWWCLIGDAPAIDKSRARTKTVLARARTNSRAGIAGHEVIQLSNAPSEVLGQNHIDAAAGGQRKSVLRASANQRLPRMRGANQKFRERHKVVELAQIQPGTKQVTLHGSVELDTSDVAVLETIPADLGRQAQHPRSVISERTGGAMVAETREGVAGTEIQVLVHSRQLIPRNEHARRARVRGRRSRKWGWPRCRRQREYTLRRHRLAGSYGPAGSRILFRIRGGVRRMVARSAALLLRAQRQSQ